MTTVAIAGSTGSIGRQALDVIRAANRVEPGRFAVTALGAGSGVGMLVEQAAEFGPSVVAVADEGAGLELKRTLEAVRADVEVRAGSDALGSIATTADVVVNAVVGFAGLGLTLAALRAGKRLALANKESLIAGGPAVAAVRDTPGCEIVPIDSEHSALHQCLRSGRRAEVRRLVLTASGGPFRTKPIAELAEVGVTDALAHPTWSMGPKITVDSSTLMNKGLEVIEAHELFGFGYDRIDVVIHPQSVMHSMVEWCDGATLAQLSQPDMHLPIGYALGWPERMEVAFGRLDWAEMPALTFEQPDVERFPCLGLAYDAGRAGGLRPAWLNAANEVAVAAFLAGELRWLDIARVIAGTLDSYEDLPPPGPSLAADSVIEADRMARVRARELVARL